MMEMCMNVCVSHLGTELQHIVLKPKDDSQEHDSEKGWSVSLKHRIRKKPA